MRAVVVGTRGSQLALAQTRQVVERLKELWPDTEFTIRTVSTSGDRGASPLERGIFVKELEDALLRGDIDIAVHSYKDLPTKQPLGLKVASVPRRVDPREAFIGRNGVKRLSDLPKGARVGTGSPRRRAQLLAFRDDLEVRPIRGNVDTRLDKLGRGEDQRVHLAAAGLLRLDLRNRIDEFVDPEVILPAPAQGALALEVRIGDDLAEELAYSLNHRETQFRVEAERAFLAALGAGCLAPVGALAYVEGEDLRLEGLVASPDGSELIRGEIEGPVEEAKELGAELARDFLDQGAGELFEEVRT